MLTRLSARRTSTLSSVRPPPPPSSPLSDELSLLRWSTSSSLPPRPSSAPLPPSPFSPPSTKTLSGLSNPFSSSSSSPPPLSKLSRSPPPPIVPKPPTSSIPPSPSPPPPSSPSPSAALPPPPRPTSIRDLPILQPSSTPLPTPLPEILPPSKFQQLLELAKEQTPRHAHQARNKPEIPGMHDRRFKACLTTTGGAKLTTVDLQELGLRLAVMGRLKREFGVLERVEFGSNPSLFTFPPVPSSTFSFTILHPHPNPPTTNLKNSSEKGYLLTGSLPLPLASPGVGGPSLAQILQTAAHYPSNVLRDIHPYSTNHQKVLQSRGEYALELDGHQPQPNQHRDDNDDSIITSRQFLIEITPDHDWNPSYVLDPHATFQTPYSPPFAPLLRPSSAHQPELEHAMISLETQLWSQGDLKSFSGFSDGLKEARGAMGKRLKEVMELDAREAEGGFALDGVRSLPRVGMGEREGVERRLRGGPFGESPPVMGVNARTRTRREGGLSGERVRVEDDEEESEGGFGLIGTGKGRSSPFAEVAPHLRGTPRFEDASSSKPTSLSPPVPSSLTSSPPPRRIPSSLAPPTTKTFKPEGKGLLPSEDSK